ncbi:NAD-dependent succinate-semialdehyde dehydrogenase [Kistimonas asteriae]|uniref:NAD-dependent succinate-semialdehyde dehydrogenase n=1 Tax=Kistimonas asteriae TaxID=517724 RepID=UPI001BA93B5C|nr:NAD-dependent succinate-semialdehyde dehydrogenase [Kistimonas asteriae]
MQLNDQNLLRSQAYVDGGWVSSQATLPVTNPADGELLANVPDLGAAETDLAIQAAERAQKLWKQQTAKARSAILRRWYELIIEHQEDLALLMTSEQGKPLAEACGEVLYGASFVEWFAEEGKRAYGDVVPEHLPGRKVLVTREPVGVVAAITPWNFPIAMITRKAAPALAAGCSIVIKPAEATPLCALALAELAERAGVPAGVLNVVTTARPADVGQALCASPIVRKLSFTGSTGIGKLLMKQCVDTVKKVSMELGGNAPFIVFEDADIDRAVEGLMVSKFRNSGQTCVCTNRVFVHDSIYDTFVDKLAAQVEQLKVAPGVNEESQQGPLINDAAVLKVEQHVADAVEKGGRLLVGGQRHSLGGSFYEPTVIADASTEMQCFREEIFGPVAPVFRFSREEEVVAMANDTEYGLAAYFYARDLGRVFRVAEALEYGMVAVNEGILSTEVAPFGGYKESGIGREGSKYGLDEYLEIKYTLLGGL